MRSATQATTAPTRRRTIMALLVAAVVGGGTVASAQAGPEAGRGAGDIVAGTRHDRPLRAAIEAAGPRLAQGAAVPAPVHSRSSWVVRHPVMTGTLIGAGGGAVLSRVTAVGGANHDPRVILLGAGAGAWGGLIASAVQKARANEKIGIGTKVGIISGAVALAVLPLLACYGAGGCGGVS